MRSLIIFIVSFFLMPPVYAALYDRGGGLIYDDVLDVTWLQDANYAESSGYDDDGRLTLQEAENWIGYLNTNMHLGYDDWRLPATLPVNGISYNHNITYDGSSDEGYNITSPNSEMAYTFYVELGNIGYYDTEGNGPQPGYGLSNAGHFHNLVPGIGYWSGTPYPDNWQGGDAWVFIFSTGEQGGTSQDEAYAWAVRDGDVAPVPIPSTFCLFLTGLYALIGLRKKIRGHMP